MGIDCLLIMDIHKYSWIYFHKKSWGLGPARFPMEGFGLGVLG